MGKSDMSVCRVLPQVNYVLCVFSVLLIQGTQKRFNQIHINLVEVILFKVHLKYKLKNAKQ